MNFGRFEINYHYELLCGHIGGNYIEIDETVALRSSATSSWDACEPACYLSRPRPADQPPRLDCHLSAGAPRIPAHLIYNVHYIITRAFLRPAISYSNAAIRVKFLWSGLIYGTPGARLKTAGMIVGKLRDVQARCARSPNWIYLYLWGAFGCIADHRKRGAINPL